MYVDCFVVPVPTARKQDYIRASCQIAAILKEHGALSVSDFWGDDVPAGESTSFARAVRLKEDETVAIGWNVYPDRATRDACMKASMEDPRMDIASMPFDGRRVVFGGFSAIGETGSADADIGREK